jgi:hypothetical protein
LVRLQRVERNGCGIPPTMKLAMASAHSRLYFVQVYEPSDLEAQSLILQHYVRVWSMSKTDFLCILAQCGQVFPVDLITVDNLRKSAQDQMIEQELVRRAGRSKGKGKEKYKESQLSFVISDRPLRLPQRGGSNKTLHSPCRPISDVSLLSQALLQHQSLPLPKCTRS